MGKRAGFAAALLLSKLVLALLLFAGAGCGGAADTGERISVPEDAQQPSAIFPDVEEAARQGEALFNANCSACHGPGAVGTSLGPPLVHRVYHPGHHPDFSIRNAIEKGVPQHHWPFGDMAPVAGVGEQDVEKIICYVRQTQRAGGIFEGEDFDTVC